MCFNTQATTDCYFYTDMKKIIAYGDKAFTATLLRLKKEIENLHIFDEIILYTDKDLPEYIKSSPLMNERGGYWIWKPYIIQETARHSNEGDIIVYLDAGCVVQLSDEWDLWFSLLKEDDSLLVMQYRDNVDYGWSYIGQKVGVTNTTVKNYQWTKKSCVDFFMKFSKESNWIELPSLWAGALIYKVGAKKNKIIDSWLKIMLFHPNLVCDVMAEEEHAQVDGFIVHRHDQAILSALVYHFMSTENVVLYKENAESGKENAAISAERKRYYLAPKRFGYKSFKHKIKVLLKKYWFIKH